MKILGIETSSSIFSLSICDDKNIVYELRKNRLADSSNRDANFFNEAKNLLEHHRVETIKALVISIGPGMFTSLRVGLSLVKALAFSHQIPVYAMNTLDIIGKDFEFVRRPILATVNAYQNELYSARYRDGKRESDYLLLPVGEVIKMVEDDMLVVGSGVRVLENIGSLSDPLRGNFHPDKGYQPSASTAIRAAYLRIQQKKYDDVSKLEPFYIKKTDAERHYNQKNAH